MKVTNLRTVNQVALLFFCLFLSAGYVSESWSGEEILPDQEEISSIKIAGKLSSPTPTPRETDSRFMIKLEAGVFDPLAAELHAKAGISSTKSYSADVLGYYIVQFDGPVETVWKEALQTTGAEIFDYLPQFSFIVRMTPQSKAVVSALDHVRWVGIYQPAYRISQTAYEKKLVTPISNRAALPGSEASLFRVILFPGENTDLIQGLIENMGGSIQGRVSNHWKTTLKVAIPAAKILDLPAINGIKWIEPWPEWQLNNNVATDIVGVRIPRDDHGLYGEGQTVGVCDSGLDQGTIMTSQLHDDFEDGSGHGRVKLLNDLSGDGAQDNYSGHGTHVAGSILGNGIRSGSDPVNNSFPSSSIVGMAPKAKLVFQATADDDGYLVGIPDDLNTLFDNAQVNGANLHNNSWGSQVASSYTSDSAAVDQYMWDHKDFLILVAAGNEGVDMDADGVIDHYSIMSPATAKNCLTVGATENRRPSEVLQGAGYDYPWGTANWADKYPEDPIFSDHISDNPAGMAAFSSRGPTIDGRCKPDIVAPGTNIVSTRSSVATKEGWGVHNDYYMYMGGTSMATPLVTGAAALMREYLIKEEIVTNPSAAIIKAALLNSAEDINPGQYTAHGTSTCEIPVNSVPNIVEGWGRLNLADSVYPGNDRSILYYDETTGLSTGKYKRYYISVKSSGSPLKVNLVWSDYPGLPAAGGLVNDLDLSVISPAGTLYPDNASQTPVTTTLRYYIDGSINSMDNIERAIKFTPSTYPAYVDSTRFKLYYYAGTAENTDVVVYDDNGPSGLPGTELFRKTLTFTPRGWLTVGLGIEIASGSFYVALEKEGTEVEIVVSDGNPTERCYYRDSHTFDWELSGYTAYIEANIISLEYSTDFDRVNNSVGITLANPDSGDYTIKVKAYNIPQGKIQPYALVVSGDIGAGLTGLVKTGSSTYADLQAAYNAAAPADTLWAQETALNIFSENLNCNLSKAVTIHGGCNSAFIPDAQKSSTLDGILTISAGSVTIFNLIIK